MRSIRPVAILLLTIALPTEAFATVYYVSADSADSPNDSNSGTSPTTPWRNLTKVNSSVFLPGDQILFKRGTALNPSVWSGVLAPCSTSINPTCSGSVSGGVVSRIVIDSYGPGDQRPKIHGLGIPAAVSLTNQSYWEIRNLEVTNKGAARGSYWGIRVICDTTTFRVCRGVRIVGNYVHSINGLDSQVYLREGGIAVMWNLYQASATQSNYFDDVVIEGNRIEGVDPYGIYVGKINSGAIDPLCPNGPQNPDCDTSAIRPKSTGVVIRYNSLNCVSENGVLSVLTDGVVMERNVLSYAGRSEHVDGTCDSSADNHGAGGAGIWSALATNSLIQYNEVYDSQPGIDRTAFDADFGSVGTRIQYNYSHSNAGGFLLIFETHRRLGSFLGRPFCGEENLMTDDLIVRFNVSVNDGGSVFGICGYSRSPGAACCNNAGASCAVNTDCCSSSCSAGVCANPAFDISYPDQFPFGSNVTDIANNTIFLSASEPNPIISQCSGNQTLQVVGRYQGSPPPGDNCGGYACGLNFFNNVTYPVNRPPVGAACPNCVAGEICISGACITPSFATDMRGTSFHHNTYYGTFSELPAGESPSSYRNPFLLAPLARGALGEYPPLGRDHALGMKLAAGSPELNSGQYSAILGTKDFWDNPVGSGIPMNRGAYNGAGVGIVVDGTAGWFLPATANQWTNLLAGTGISNPVSVYPAQDPSVPGTLVDTVGSIPFYVGGGAPLYRQAVSGWSRWGVMPRSGTGDYFGGTGVDISMTSATFLLVVKLGAVPPGPRTLMLIGSSGEANRVDLGSTGVITARNKTNSVTGAVTQANKTVVLMIKVDRSIPRVVVYNDGVETLKPAWSPPASGVAFYLGNVALPWPENAAILYSAYWTGTNAQFSDAQASTLISRIKNGP